MLQFRSKLRLQWAVVLIYCCKEILCYTYIHVNLYSGFYISSYLEDHKADK